MNIYVVLGLVLFFILLIFKILKGIVKKIFGFILMCLIILAANYLILPRFEIEPVDIGLDRFFVEVKTSVEQK